MNLFKKKQKTPQSAITVTTELQLKHIRNGKVIGTRHVVNRKVTTAFAYDIVDVLCASTADRDKFTTYKWHRFGTSTAAESSANTDLSAQIATASVAGTQTNSGSSNVYRSIATKTFTATASVTEHGLFNTSATGGAGRHLMDRTVFAVISVSAADKIVATFTITFTPGG